jgi:pyruvate/2-oxoglutarate/acetoin dehydrogenase E1 component
VKRLTGFNTSFPAAKSMEDLYMPGADEIADTLRTTAET